MKFLSLGTLTSYSPEGARAQQTGTQTLHLSVESERHLLDSHSLNVLTPYLFLSTQVISPVSYSSPRSACACPQEGVGRADIIPTPYPPTSYRSQSCSAKSLTHSRSFFSLAWAAETPLHHGVQVSLRRSGPGFHHWLFRSVSEATSFRAVGSRLL